MNPSDKFMFFRPNKKLLSVDESIFHVQITSELLECGQGNKSKSMAMRKKRES